MGAFKILFHYLWQPNCLQHSSHHFISSLLHWQVTASLFFLLSMNAIFVVLFEVQGKQDVDKCSTLSEITKKVQFGPAAAHCLLYLSVSTGLQPGRPNQILHYRVLRGFLKLAIINANDRLPELEYDALKIWRLATLEKVLKQNAVSFNQIKKKRLVICDLWDYLDVLELLNK